VLEEFYFTTRDNFLGTRSLLVCISGNVRPAGSALEIPKRGEALDIGDG
jgi:hypothetical protein